jgi:excisionase family DNA binding protein
MARPTTTSLEDQQPTPVAETPPSIPPLDDREFISVREAARISGIGRTKLYDLMARGRLNFVKIDKRRLIARRSICDLGR